MFKNMRLVILFDMLLNPSFKMMTSFTNRARTTASTVKLYTRKDFKLLGIGSLYGKKKFILNELKASLRLKLSLQNSLESFESFIFIWCVKLPIYGNFK